MFLRALFGAVLLFCFGSIADMRIDSLLAQDVEIAVDIEAAKKEAAAAIAEEVESYVAAFNSKDSAKLASHWSPRGIHTNRTTGNRVVGREAIEQEFNALFKEADNLKLVVNSEEIEFISPSVAIDHGRASVTQTGTDKAERSEYSAVFVFREGRWLVDRISDVLISEEDSHHEHLRELEWLIGTWINETEGVTVETECKWTQDQNHISRAYRLIEDDNVEHHGLQIIGWDPNSKHIRSWLFDSDGGFVEGTWAKKDNSWLITAKGILPDGGVGTAVNIVRPIDEDRLGYRKTQQVIDGVVVDDSDEVILQRQK